jgi:hypothetical protein
VYCESAVRETLQPSLFDALDAGLPLNADDDAAQECAA